MGWATPHGQFLQTPLSKKLSSEVNRLVDILDRITPYT
jgi:hypothetical protein